MKYSKICILVGVVIIVGTAYGASLIQPASFPKTFEDLSFSQRMEILADGYSYFAELSPYQQIEIMSAEEAAQIAIDAINAQKCAQTGVACDAPPPTPDGSVYVPPAQQQPTQQAPKQTPPQTNATGYCARRQPTIPVGQQVPLGSPVNPDDVPANHTDSRTTKFISNTKKGLFCDGFRCREKCDSRGKIVPNKYRPHQGVDIGCTADFFKIPVYTPADGTVVSVIRAQQGKSAGNYILIRHTDGFETQYMHLESIFVTEGQQVQAGCSIGELGHSGGNADYASLGMSVTNSHLHYEIKYKGKASTFQAPNGTQIPIVRADPKRNCTGFQTKINPKDFITYYWK